LRNQSVEPIARKSRAACPILVGCATRGPAPCGSSTLRRALLTSPP
jgi:hypothetical protein